MIVTTVPEKQPEEYADQVAYKGGGTFQSRELRDKVVRLLIEQGYSVSRAAARNQQLHPEYVTDYVGRLETGFGNSQYQMFWSKLYMIRVNR